jgi:beta-glucosidase
MASERVLHELYLRPFEGAIADGVMSAMCSYDQVNGTASCGNSETLQMLETKLNFSGFVVSDWDAILPQDEAASFNAGLDITMSGAVPTEALALISNATIDRAVLRILTAMYTIGVFDRHDYGHHTDSVTSAAHYELAQLIAEQSTVLLVNKDGALPIDPATSCKFAVIGSSRGGVHGVGSGSAGQGDQQFRHGDRVISSAEGLAMRLAASSGKSEIANLTIDWSAPETCAASDCIMPVTQEFIDKAVVLASKAEGESIVSGEGVDRKDLSLGNGGADMQSRLVASVAAANNITIVVLRAPGTIAPLPFLELPTVRAVCRYLASTRIPIQSARFSN